MLAPDLLSELRQRIFASRQGSCFEVEELRKIYCGRKAIARATISHLVSCAYCLDNANRLLGLGLLRERSAIDVLDRDNYSEDQGLSAIRRLVKDGIGVVASCLLWLTFLADTLGYSVEDFL
jgi:hypothetical protein